MDFSEALKHAKAGEAITRKGWNGANQSVRVQRPDEHSKMTLPYLYIVTVSGDQVPWLASQGDLMAEDWEIVKEDA